MQKTPNFDQLEIVTVQTNSINDIVSQLNEHLSKNVAKIYS